MVKITGPRGVAGPPASRGKPGTAGAKGKPGSAVRVASDPSPAAEPTDTRMEVLAVVEGQIENVHHELDLQMERIAHLQREVDEVRKAIQLLAGKSS